MPLSSSPLGIPKLSSVTPCFRPGSSLGCPENGMLFCPPRSTCPWLTACFSQSVNHAVRFLGLRAADNSSTLLGGIPAHGWCFSAAPFETLSLVLTSPRMRRV